MSDSGSSSMGTTRRGAPIRARLRDPWLHLSDADLPWDRPAGGMMPPFPRMRRGFFGQRGWIPLVDMYEEGDNLIIKAELPGVAKEDIDVSVDQGDLVIRGERESEDEIEEDNYYRRERLLGSFYRRLPLPEGVQPNQIAASFKDGVLEVRMPKPQTAETSAASKIQVS
jgi:HSP20 family protein